MFVRFLAGAFHPFIHTGYAVEVRHGAPIAQDRR